MPRSLYSILVILLQPMVLLRLWFKGAKAPAYRQRIRERYGFDAPNFEACVWVHSVSVGETITAKPVIEYLLKHSALPVLVTTTTPTGAAQVLRLFGERVTHRYMPQDISVCLQRLLSRCKPKLLIVMETELWPNLIHTCWRNAVPTMLVNGRLSAKSAQAYAKLGGLTTNMLRHIDTLCVQTDTEQQRFIALGASPERCVTVPSLKFEATISEAQRAHAAQVRVTQALCDRFVWIAASTHPGEDERILAAHADLLVRRPDALLILVPRHPERFDTVAQLCDARGLATVRHSTAQSVADNAVWLLDEMGLLMTFYGVADVAFVGGSLQGGGGHNLMEPALWSLPVLSGPGLFNFQAVSEQLCAAQALTIVSDERQLSAALIRLLDTSLRQQQGANALAVAQRNKGGLEQTISQIKQLFPC